MGLEQLRQHTSDYVKRAEAGETLLITVAGRPSAVLGPAARKQRNSFDDIASVFDTASDPTLAADLASMEDTVRDPWASEDRPRYECVDQKLTRPHRGRSRYRLFLPALRSACCRDA